MRHRVSSQVDHVDTSSVLLKTHPNEEKRIEKLMKKNEKRKSFSFFDKKRRFISNDIQNYLKKKKLKMIDLSTLKLAVQLDRIIQRHSTPICDEFTQRRS